MSRQIQSRRGSSAEHETFTGAPGEITVDTTNNTLRIHDGQTPDGTPLAKQSEIPAVNFEGLLGRPDYSAKTIIAASSIKYADQDYLAICSGGNGASQGLFISTNSDMSSAQEIITTYITASGSVFFRTQAIIPAGVYFRHTFTTMQIYPITKQ